MSERGGEKVANCYCAVCSLQERVEPIVKIGEYLAIPDIKQGKKTTFLKVKYIEPVQPITITQSLSPLETNKEIKLTQIELWDNVVGQWRLYVMDYVGVRMFYPKATAKWTTKTAATSATPLSIFKENILEFFTYKDNVPYIYLDNPLNEAQLARIVLFGFKYYVEKVPEKPPEYTTIPIYSAEFIVGGVEEEV